MAQAHQATLGLLQITNGSVTSLGRLPSVLLTAVDTVLEKLMEEVSYQLKRFLKFIKPTLIQVGKWVKQFSEKVQDVIDEFSTTLDRVQKIFDQIMSNMAGGGIGEELM